MSILDKFTDMLRMGFYYDAHELLEENLWDKNSKSDLNLYYKGLINAAVAMELIKRGRINQGKKVWKTFLKYKIESFYEVNHRVEKQYDLVLKGIR